MKILVVGSGGREHALIRAFRKSPLVTEVHVAPGAPGLERWAVVHQNASYPLPNAPQKSEHVDQISIPKLALALGIDLVFIGPEIPLASGLSDELRALNIATVGPSMAAAQLEGSKIFAKTFMQTAGVPTSRFQVVDSVKSAVSSAKNFTPPYVFKADGLAAGKGVYICKSLDELAKAAHEVFELQIFGENGKRGLIEEFMPGWELSYLILTNGRDYQTLPLAQDHKRLNDDDQGPNTGGMGTVAPMKISQVLDETIRFKVVEPTLAELQKRKLLYRGVLYIGLMINNDQPFVLEYNCRFGDPETQVILPLISNDFALVSSQLAMGVVPPISTHPNRYASCVVLSAPGYPENPQKGLPISGALFDETPTRYFDQAGVGLAREQWVTNGGRVLNSIGIGSSPDEALRQSYIHTKSVSWPGLHFRTDIGKTWKT